MSHLDLFAIPLYRTIIGEPTESELKYLESQPMTEGRSTALNSENLAILNTIQLRDLQGRVHKGLQEYQDHLGVDTAQVEMRITTSWLNRYHKGHSTHQHHHSNSIISGVYYLEDCDKSAPIQFHRAPGYVNLWPNTINLPIKGMLKASLRTFSRSGKKLSCCSRIIWSTRIHPGGPRCLSQMC